MTKFTKMIGLALIGLAIAAAYAPRGAEALAKAAADLRKAHPDVDIIEVAGDITTPDAGSRFARCP